MEEKAKILLVDDTPENIDTLGTLLKDYKRQVALNGEKALKLARKDPKPDLILLDIMMPGIDGYEVCTELKKDIETRDIPIIFLTSKTDRESLLKGFDIGAQDYITKPFDVRELMARVKTQLEIVESRKKLKSVNIWLEEIVDKRTQELGKANMELLGLDEAKNDFLKMISHEIRTPLNGIVGATYLLNDVMGDDNEFGEFVDMLKVSVDRLENFSTTALVITQLQADNYVISKELNKAENVVDSCIDSLEEYSKEQNLDIIKGIVDSSIEINIDEKLFKRALKSVIHNAVKYSRERDKVTVNALKNDQNTTIEVVDKGTGFTEDALNRLFQPFGMGEKHYDQNVGLSLRAAKMIMKAHNGDIIIENQSGKGAKVSLVINN